MCGKPIKKRLVENKVSAPRLCYAHWIAKKKRHEK